MRATTSTAADLFREVYDDTYLDVLRFAQRRVAPAVAEDVVADTMLTAWRRVADLPPDPDARRAWVFGIARKCLLNATRSARRGDALAVRVADAHVTRPATVDESDLLDLRLDIARAWALLSPQEQETLALTVLDGLDSAGAGEVLGITAAAYRLRLTRARRALRSLLDQPRTGPEAQVTTTTTTATDRQEILR